MDAPVREPVIEVRGLVNRFGRHVEIRKIGLPCL